MTRLFKSKTTWVALAALVATVGAYVNGEVNIGQAIQTVFTALFGVTLRDTIANVGK